jgi:DNA replication protein DnaC
LHLSTHILIVEEVVADGSYFRNGGSIISGMVALIHRNYGSVQAGVLIRKQLIKYELLVIDEWLLFPIDEEDAQQLLWVIDRRHNHKATIIASQYEPAEWLDQIPIPVAAEAITDRLAAKAYRIVIKGNKSMRLMF